MDDTGKEPIAPVRSNGERLSDSRKYGRPKDPRLVPEMAEKVPLRSLAGVHLAE